MKTTRSDVEVWWPGDSSRKWQDVEAHWDYRSENGALTIIDGKTETTVHPICCELIAIKEHNPTGAS